MNTAPCPRRAMHVVRIVLVVLAAVPACRTGAPAPTAATLDGDGDGVRDDADLCPDSPEDRDGFDDWDGCPEAGDGRAVSWRFSGVDAGPPEPEPPPAVDSDGDGILDLNDACPSEAEDRDNFDDKDGCPDPDNDLDRVPDVTDKCPNEPETYNGVEDEDGCPDSGRPRPPRPQSQIKEGPIAFDENSAAIRGETAAILDSIAVFIRDRPGAVHQVALEGHAEAYERDAPALAVARAQAVRRYLVKRGVPAGLVQPPSRANNPLRSLIGGDDNDGRSRRRVDLTLRIAR